MNKKYNQHENYKIQFIFGLVIVAIGALVYGVVELLKYWGINL